MSDDLKQNLRGSCYLAFEDGTNDYETAPEAADRIEELEAKLVKAVEALGDLHHAVCGETGFAHCVRVDSGKAYPWPALDMADWQACATLAELKGEQP